MSIFKYLDSFVPVKSAAVEIVPYEKPATDHPMPAGARLVPGYPHYCVTDQGVVYSCRVYGSKARRRGPWWVMKQKQCGKFRYPYVDLFVKVGKPKRWMIHQIVLLAFRGPPPQGLIGRHWNDDPLDNRLSNLLYGTKIENGADSIRNGKMSLGERHYNAKFTNEQVREIRKLHNDGISSKALAERFQVPSYHIYSIVHRRSWKHV